MADGDTIRLLGRYYGGAVIDPRENRLTAAVTALLSDSQPLANCVAHGLMRDGTQPPAKTVVTMQRPVGGNVGWVDLELDVRRPERTVIWIEAKLGSGLSGETQLDKYRVQLTKFDHAHAEKVVLLLVPAQARGLFANVPPLRERTEPKDLGPYLVTWQDLYGMLQTRISQPQPPHVTWLLEEVLGYMKSDKLALSALEHQHFEAFNNIEAARAAVATVFDATRDFIKDDGWILVPAYNVSKGDYWEFGYQPWKRGSKASRWTQARLAWGFAPPDFFAGVCFQRDRGGPVEPRRDGRWCANLLAHGSIPAGASGWDEDGSYRNLLWVTCSQNISALARGASPNDQARGLANFVCEAFSEAVRARSR